MIDVAVKTMNVGQMTNVNGMSVDSENGIIIFKKIDILNAFDTEPEPLDFVLPGLLIGTVGAVIAPGATGKSMLALQIALAVTTGIDIAKLFSDENNNEKIKIGDVVYFAAEDPSTAIAHRLHDLGKHIKSIDEYNENTRMGIEEGLTIIPLMGMQPDIFEPIWFRSIKEAARGCRLLIIDTLRRFHSLDENDGGQMADMLSKLEAIATEAGCAIIFIHHSSKAAAMNNQGDMQQASRGSSVLVDNVRWQMYLAGMSKEDAKDKKVEEVQRNIFVKCGVSKQNYGKPFAEKWLRRVNGGVLTEAHLTQCSNLTKKKEKKGNREEV